MTMPTYLIVVGDPGSGNQVEVLVNAADKHAAMDAAEHATGLCVVSVAYDRGDNRLAGLDVLRI